MSHIVNDLGLPLELEVTFSVTIRRLLSGTLVFPPELALLVFIDILHRSITLN